MRIRVLSYNIHKCIGGLDRRYDPHRICQTIEHFEPDIVLMQEVDYEVSRSDHHRQVDLLGDALKFPFRAWFSNVKIRGGGSYGNAILSRFPLQATHNLELTQRYKKARSALYACAPLSTESQGRRLHLFNLHLGLAEYERKRQVRGVLASDLLAKVREHEPVIVAGDLNDLYGTLGPRLFKPAGFESGGTRHRTFPAYAPLGALDGFYVRGDLRIVQTQRGLIPVAKRASDHLPLIADLELWTK